MDQKRYDIGLAKRKQVLGDAYVDRALNNVDDFNRDFQRILTEYCWGETWGDETLKPRERSILNLGMIAALGKMEEFATHVRGALNNGLTPNEIRAAPSTRRTRNSEPSCPALCRASTSLVAEDVDGRDKPGHDERGSERPARCWTNVAPRTSR
jgi:4-carboxymuconolactone decarboxylase